MPSLDQRDALVSQLDDRPLDDGRPRQHARMDQVLAGWHREDRHLHEAEHEVQARLPRQVLPDGLDAFADAVADDEQQQPPLSEVARDRVDELILLHHGAGLGDEVVQDAALALEPASHLSLQVLVPPAAELLGVVQDLPHHLAPRLGVPPELALDEDQEPLRVDERHIDGTRPRAQLAAQGHQAVEGRVELGDRQDLGVTEHQVLDEGLVVGASTPAIQPVEGRGGAGGVDEDRRLAKDATADPVLVGAGRRRQRVTADA